jgi:hypothetical protein
MKFEHRKAPSRSVVTRSDKKFERVIDKNMGVVGNKKSVRTPENIHHVEQTLT